MENNMLQYLCGCEACRTAGRQWRIPEIILGKDEWITSKECEFIYAAINNGVVQSFIRSPNERLIKEYLINNSRKNFIYHPHRTYL